MGRCSIMNTLPFSFTQSSKGKGRPLLENQKEVKGKMNRGGEEAWETYLLFFKQKQNKIKIFKIESIYKRKRNAFLL